MPREEVDALVQDKFQVVLAVQRYALFADPKSHLFDVHEVAAVEALLETFGKWLSIAYIEEIPSLAGKRYYSCLTDASCPMMPELPATHHSCHPVSKTLVGMRRPKFRIELPGFPILGHGKSDNQNCALIFTRGEVLQMIDANQDAYFEAALFLPLALQEMVGPTAVKHGGRRPGIIGFREHIFSDVGLLGRLAADSEFAFGTVIQRTMDRPLEARLHYGHPDIMDKLQMVQQGGVSKATRGLHLSEDVFAGLDLVLRGGWTDYKEYFHVGKGRDMGFMSALSFYAKVSMGNGEQAITRQWVRLGLELPLPRLLGVFYTHVGYYLNQMLMTSALQTFAFMTAFFALCQPMDMGFADAAVSVTTTYFGVFYLLFVLASMLPLLLEVCIEEGLRAALCSVANSLLSLSPVFAAFQSKLMGHYFKTTAHYGGAQYIPTGRGLATSREPFSKLFRTFAVSHMQDGMELILFLCLGAGIFFGWVFYLCMCFSVASWMGAPFLFNPHQFDSISQACQDFQEWVGWLSRGTGLAAESWVTWVDSEQSVRRSASIFWLFIPSSRLLGLACTTALTLQLAPMPAITSPALVWARSLLALLPPLAHMIICALAALLGRCATAPLAPIPPHVLLAALAVAGTCFEMSAIQWWSSTAVCVLFHKYMAVRFLLEVADFIVAHRLGGCALGACHDACRLWTCSWRFLRDLFLGLVLSSACMVMALMPGLAEVHALFLFRALPQKEQASCCEGNIVSEASDPMHCLFERHLPKQRRGHEEV